ncbi:hypothetical protein VNI00_013561 [Paramarasmius palmivorus]|uniref:Cytochrome P450 n=1 Tax=Paramarasmius palmivorus TaxID=297713 RepID=A0AAW0BWV8_9AGAR
MHLIGLQFGPGLLSTPLGPQHRKQRKMLNPAFSIAHMRDLLPVFYQVAHKLESSIARKVQDGPQEIDMLGWMGRTAIELIGQSGLGVSFDPLEDEETTHPFIKVVKEVNLTAARLAFETSYILPYVVNIGTPSLRRLVSRLIPNKNFQFLRGRTDDLWRISMGIFEEKKRALVMGDEALKQRVGCGKDVLSILMRENMKATDEERLDEMELLGQSFDYGRDGYDIGGHHRSIPSLLATHTEVQSKLREELIQAFQNGDIAYDELVSLPYLDAICRETLRLYAPVTKLDRVAKHDTVLPLSMPVVGRDGSLITEVVVPKNTTIAASVLNANRNPEVWGKDAHEWKPERWLEPLPSTVMDANVPGVYSHLMTFNGGQRSCIGFKFSQLEMKVVLARLVLRFEFLPSGKDIEWENAGVTSPLVEDHVNGSSKPAMPLVVGLIKD